MTQHLAEIPSRVVTHHLWWYPTTCSVMSVADLDAIKLALSTALRVALAEAGLKQTELGELIGYSQSAVTAWLTCQNAISIEAVLLIDEVLFLSPSLLVRSGLVPPSSVMDAIEVDGALDDQGRDDMRAKYRECIGETARRRIAVVSVDGDDTVPAETLFGPGWPNAVDAHP